MLARDRRERLDALIVGTVASELPTAATVTAVIFFVFGVIDAWMNPAEAGWRLATSEVPAAALAVSAWLSSRGRNLESFRSGSSTVLVATDIAARGIHVDEVALVVHVDPPAEHKAYLHRSGRTARAGTEGTVVTIVTPDQADDARKLAKAAGIQPQVTKVTPAHELLVALAPNRRP